MKINLQNDLVVKNLKSSDKPYYCMSDHKSEKGFGILIYPSGSKTFIFKYKIDGVQKHYKLGEYPFISLKDARDEYFKASIKVKDLRKGKSDGLDPVKEKKMQKERRIEEDAEDKRNITVADLVEKYLTKHAMVKKRSWKEDERILNREIIPTWGRRKAKNINGLDIENLMESIVDRGAPIMANNVFKVIRKMFSWSIETNKLTDNPCRGKKLPSEKVERERHLNENEIKVFIDSLNRIDISMSNETKRALKLILYTAQRPGEVIGMHTREIDGEWWTIPAERSKNKKTHRVCLTPTAREIINQAIERVKAIREIPSETKYEGFIFPCPHLGKEKAIDTRAMAHAIRNNYYLENSKRKKILKNEKPTIINRFGIEPFTPHDLRRTAATLMAEMGTMDEVIDAVLNHAKQGVIKIYNQYRYDKEKQLALEALERKINSIISGKVKDNVVSIQSAKKNVA